jgi:hypothetical protein
VSLNLISCNVTSTGKRKYSNLNEPAKTQMSNLPWHISTRTKNGTTIRLSVFRGLYKKGFGHFPEAVANRTPRV